MREIVKQLAFIIAEIKEMKAYLKFIRKTRREMFLEEWVDGPEVMEMLGISTRTLQSMRTNNILPFSRINGKFYYRMEDIEKLLESNYNGKMKPFYD